MQQDLAFRALTPGPDLSDSTFVILTARENLGGRPGAAVHAVWALALLVEGRTEFTTAGHGSIGAGQAQATVGVGSANSHVMVSLVTDPGAPVAVSWIERADDSFTVHLTGAVVNETVLSYFVVDPV